MFLVRLEYGKSTLSQGELTAAGAIFSDIFFGACLYVVYVQVFEPHIPAG